MSVEKATGGHSLVKLVRSGMSPKTRSRPILSGGGGGSGWAR